MRSRITVSGWRCPAGDGTRGERDVDGVRDGARGRSARALLVQRALDELLERVDLLAEFPLLVGRQLADLAEQAGDEAALAAEDSDRGRPGGRAPRRPARGPPTNSARICAMVVASLMVGSLQRKGAGRDRPREARPRRNAVPTPSRERRLGGRCRGGAFDLGGDGGKRLGLRRREVGQHLPVERDAGGLEAVDQLAVGEARARAPRR